MKRKPIFVHRKPIFVPRIITCPYTHPFGYIYMYTNKLTGSRYIGKHMFSKPFIDPNYHGSGKHWRNALKKYGKSNFEQEILFWLEDDKVFTQSELVSVLNQKEVFFIDLFGTYLNPQDYNETPGGDGMSSECVSGNLNPMYGVHRYGKENPMYGVHRYGEENPMYGKHHSEESKLKMRKAKQGKYLKQNNPNYGNHKLAGENHFMYGKHHSEETKRKISEAHKGKTLSLETRQKMSLKRQGKNNPNYKGPK